MREVQVRLTRTEEAPHPNALVREHRHLGFRKVSGQCLWHLAVHRGRWLALLGWHAAALHSAAREPGLLRLQSQLQITVLSALRAQMFRLRIVCGPA